MRSIACALASCAGLALLLLGAAYDKGWLELGGIVLVFAGILAAMAAGRKEGKCFSCGRPTGEGADASKEDARLPPCRFCQGYIEPPSL